MDGCERLWVVFLVILWVVIYGCGWLWVVVDGCVIVVGNKRQKRTNKQNKKSNINKNPKIK